MSNYYSSFSTSYNYYDSRRFSNPYGFQSGFAPYMVPVVVPVPRVDPSLIENLQNSVQSLITLVQQNSTQKKSVVDSCTKDRYLDRIEQKPTNAAPTQVSDVPATSPWDLEISQQEILPEELTTKRPAHSKETIECPLIQPPILNADQRPPKFSALTPTVADTSSSDLMNQQKPLPEEFLSTHPNHGEETPEYPADQPPVKPSTVNSLPLECNSIPVVSPNTSGRSSNVLASHATTPIVTVPQEPLATIITVRIGWMKLGYCSLERMLRVNTHASATTTSMQLVFSGCKINTSTTQYSSLWLGLGALRLFYDGKINFVRVGFLMVFYIILEIASALAEYNSSVSEAAGGDVTAVSSSPLESLDFALGLDIELFCSSLTVCSRTALAAVLTANY